MIDLHTHTTASDGQYSPKELIQKAHKEGISVLAITDHDTVCGLEEGTNAAKELGVTFVPGVEININRPGCEFHLLGLGLKNISQSLKDLLSYLQNNRDSRNVQIIQFMNDEGINVSLKEMQEELGVKVLGRPHIAFWLTEHKIVKNRQQAFDKYLARGRPWYVEKAGVNLDEAVNAIYESGGVPVIAHPLSLYLSWSKLEIALKDYKERGVLGLEAYHPGARVSECERLEKIARELGFFVTAGSDFHGEQIRRDRKLGHTCGNYKIKDTYWTDELKINLK